MILEQQLQENTVSPNRYVVFAGAAESAPEQFNKKSRFAAAFFSQQTLPGFNSKGRQGGKARTTKTVHLVRQGVSKKPTPYHR